MPESVLSSFGRALGWVINKVGEPRNWSPTEYTLLKGLSQQLGKRGAVRYRNFEDHGTFQTMLTDLGSDTPGAQRHTVLVPSTVVINTSITIPANITLVRTQGGKFVLTDYCELRFTPGSKLITEDDVQVFDVSAGNVGIGGLYSSHALAYLTPEMFGGGSQGLMDLIAATEHFVGNINTWDTDDQPIPVHLNKSFTMTGSITISDANPVEYIKPDVVITIGSGLTLQIDAMTALYEHTPFAGTGTLVLNHKAVHQQYLMIRDAIATPSVIPEGYAGLYLDSGEGSSAILVNHAGAKKRLNPTYIDPRSFGNGTRIGTNIELACTYAVANGGIVALTGGTYAITSAKDFQSVPLLITPGSHLIISSGFAPSNMVIYGDPLHQIISCAVADVPDMSKNPFVRPEWFGTNALDKALAAHATVAISKDVTLTGDTTQPSDIHVEFSNGAKVITGAYTYTCNGTHNDALHQIWDGSGVTYGAGVNMPHRRVEWFGPLVNNDIATGLANAATINKAIASISHDGYRTKITFPSNMILYIDGTGSAPILKFNKNNCTVDFIGCHFRVLESYVDTVVQFGGDSGVEIGNSKLIGLKIQRLWTNSPPQAAADKLKGVALLIQNATDCSIDTPAINGVGTALRFYADNSAVSYFDVYNPLIGTSLVGLHIGGGIGVARGWTTQINFYSGKFSFGYTNFNATQAGLSGSRLVKVENCANFSTNGIRFYGTVIENAAERKVDIVSGTEIVFDNCYYDPGSFNTSVQRPYNASVTGASTTAGSKVITKTTHGLYLLTGDKLRVTGGSDTTDYDDYVVISYDANTVTVDKEFSGTVSNLAFTVYRANILFSANTANCLILAGPTLNENVVVDMAEAGGYAYSGRNMVIDPINGISVGTADPTNAAYGDTNDFGLLTLRSRYGGTAKLYVDNDYQPSTSATSAIVFRGKDSYGHRRNFADIIADVTALTTNTVVGRFLFRIASSIKLLVGETESKINRLLIGFTDYTETIRSMLGVKGNVIVGYYPQGTETAPDDGIVAEGQVIAGMKAFVKRAGDAASQISQLRIYNATAGTYYWTLTNSGTTRTFNIYNNVAGGAGDLILTGSLVGDGRIILTEANNSDMGGVVIVTYTTDDTDLAANILTVTLPSVRLVVNADESVARAAIEIDNPVVDSYPAIYAQNDAQRWAFVMADGRDSDAVNLWDITNNVKMLTIKPNSTTTFLKGVGQFNVTPPTTIPAHIADTATDAVTTVAVAAGATPTKGEFDALVNAYNALAGKYNTAAGVINSLLLRDENFGRQATS